MNITTRPSSQFKSPDKVCIWYLLLVCLLLGFNPLQAQSEAPTSSIKYHLLDIPNVSLKHVDYWAKSGKKMLPSNVLILDLIYSKYYGKICQWESRRDNRTGQKVRFRLGTLADTDRLEGK